MSILHWGRTSAPEVHPVPEPAAHPPHHLRQSVSTALAHIPHSLPEAHAHYPPLHPSYLESSRMSREMKHL